MFPSVAFEAPTCGVVKVPSRYIEGGAIGWTSSGFAPGGTRYCGPLLKFVSCAAANIAGSTSREIRRVDRMRPPRAYTDIMKGRAQRGNWRDGQCAKICATDSVRARSRGELQIPRYVSA